MQNELRPKTAAELLRRTERLGTDSTLGVAALALGKAPGGVIALVDPVGRFAGVLTEQSLMKAVSNGAARDDSVESALQTIPIATMSSPEAEVAEFLREAPFVAVLDDDGSPRGLIGPSDLFPKPPLRYAPYQAGGLATPIGVYLVGGGSWAGPRPWGLVYTGAVMATLFTISTVVSMGLYEILQKSASNHAWMLHYGDIVFGFLPLLVFGALMRMHPISGVHAAEHMVVHALERGEPLTIPAVRRLPRVHPRCGTNFAVGLFLFIGIATTDVGLSEDMYPFQLMAALLATMLLWRRLGGFVQYWITTKRPTDVQIQMGIDSANQLVDKYSKTSRSRTTPWSYLWLSGLIHVGIGATLTLTIVRWLFRLIHRQDLTPF